MTMQKQTSWLRRGIRGTMLLSTTPADGAVGVNINTTVLLVFNKPMQLPLLIFENEWGIPVAHTVAYNGGNLNQILLTPVAPLGAGTGYAVSGNFDAMGKPFYGGSFGISFWTAP